ncbi:MAG TPA: AAA family ATPase, partial [Terriglobales bacterium]|nr:AAA family ATPase [Terriglobales bacterium]
MLKSLYIENIAVIDRLDIELSEGFTVLTGETGAGKSIIIDAIGLLLGGRVSRDLIRSGESAAAVSALFEGSGGETGETAHEISIERTLSADGRSAVRLDGKPATVAMLRELGETLVNIHGQHDSGWLLQPERHILFLDELAGAGELLSSYRESYDKVSALKAKIEGLRMDEREKSRRLDMLRFQVGEIAGANLVPGEAEKLHARRTVMQNAQRLARAVSAVCEALDPEDGEGAVSLAGAALRQLSSCASLSDRLSELAERLGNSYYALTDVAAEVRDFLDELDFDPADTDRVETRLDLIQKLCRKYGDTVEEVIAYGERAGQELSDIELSDERINALEKELAHVYNELTAKAE